MFGREAKGVTEEALVLKCYYAGMKNGWASGEYAIGDGNFIAEEDRLNTKSIMFIDTKRELKRFFKYGNWCLGQGVIHKDLFFLQQVNGGDEWATYKIIGDEIKKFESISFQRIIECKEFDKYMKSLSGTIKEYFKGA